MQILSVGNFGTGWDGSQCDEEHIAGALEELGHEVFRYQRETTLMPKLTGHPDFILIAQWDKYSDELLEQIRMLESPIVYWAFDYQADGQEWHERLVREADLYLSKRIADSKYPNWQYLSQDFAPKFLDKLGVSVQKDIEVLFTGSYLPWATERNETLRAVNEKFNLVIHSVNSWPEEWNLDVRPPIMDEGLPELYARAKVILSIDHTIETGYYSDRNAQIMACGAMPLFGYVPLSESTFHDGVIYFYNIEDCLGKIRRMLKLTDEDLDSLGERAHKIAHITLMVNNRVKDLEVIVNSFMKGE